MVGDSVFGSHADQAGLAAADGLALEYQGNYGSARGDLDVSYLVNNPVANGVCRISRRGFDEKSLGLLLGQGSPLSDD